MIGIQTGTRVNIRPKQFYCLVDIMLGVPNSLYQSIESIDALVQEEIAKYDSIINKLEFSYRSLEKENDRTTKQNPFKKSDELELEVINERLGNSSFISVIFNIFNGLRSGIEAISKITEEIRPPQIHIPEERVTNVHSIEEFQRFQVHYEMNVDEIARLEIAFKKAGHLQYQILGFSRQIVNFLESYYERLSHRHRSEGIQIHVSPILTDLAFSIYENVDSHGEIEAGKKVDQISAFSMRKALLVAQSLKTEIVRNFIQVPDEFIKLIQGTLRNMWQFASAIREFATPIVKQINSVSREKHQERVLSDSFFEQGLKFIEDLDPSNIEYLEPKTLQTAEEVNELNYTNDTIKRIAECLRDEYESEHLVKYILERKEKRRKYLLEENSFYVCRIGEGNPFLGLAPGELQVVPGTRPVSQLVDVVGSGFQEAKNFIQELDSSNQWTSLFLATSPSRKTDKTNVLLIGPQGCGKTEVLRGVGSDKNSIGVFAQASDFLTCWKGEMEKNPKRLFESGLKLHKESGKQVFFLIDEIDTILNSNTGNTAFGGTNLSSEFQVLMDGIMSYSGLAIWGATNHPEKIPMPIIRRFAKVLIVGELDHDHRKDLLKRFVSFLPIDQSISEEHWNEAANKLEGAVGDVVRKIADDIWRIKMNWFVQNHSEIAKQITEDLNKDKKFDVKDFDQVQRNRLLEKLHEYVRVTPEDLLESVDRHLQNIAIQKEIETSKQVYTTARELVASF